MQHFLFNFVVDVFLDVSLLSWISIPLILASSETGERSESLDMRWASPHISPDPVDGVGGHRLAWPLQGMVGPPELTQPH
jgi:hypothetical protein